MEQAQRGGTGPKINHTCFLADLASLGRPSLRSGQLLKKGGTHEMWNKSLMWNSPKMWNWPKEVEQAQRSTIPFQQAGGKGGGGSWARCNAATSRGCHHTGTPSADGTLPRRRVVHEATTLQLCHVARWLPLPATPRRGVSVSQATLRK